MTTASSWLRTYVIVLRGWMGTLKNRSTTGREMRRLDDISNNRYQFRNDSSLIERLCDYQIGCYTTEFFDSNHSMYVPYTNQLTYNTVSGSSSADFNDKSRLIDRQTLRWSSTNMTAKSINYCTNFGCLHSDNTFFLHNLWEVYLVETSSPLFVNLSYPLQQSFTVGSGLNSLILYWLVKNSL